VKEIDVLLKPRIHDTTRCTTGCTTGWTNYVNELSQRAQPSGLVTAGWQLRMVWAVAMGTRRARISPVLHSSTRYPHEI